MSLNDIWIMNEQISNSEESRNDGCQQEGQIVAMLYNHKQTKRNTHHQQDDSALQIVLPDVWLRLIEEMFGNGLTHFERFHIQFVPALRFCVFVPDIQ